MSVVLDALAAYRLTRLLIDDELTAPARDPFVDWLAEHERHRLIYLSSCYWCLGTWVAAAVVFARHRWPRATRPLVVTLAVSAIVGLVHENLPESR